MKKLLYFGVCAVLVLGARFTEADECYPDPCEETNIFCDPCAPIGCGTKQSLWNFGGHIESGLYVNEYGRKNAYWIIDEPGPDRTSGNTQMLQNVHNSDYQANQVYLFLEKTLSKRGWDVGGKVSVMYGTDARFFQAQGMEVGAGRGAWNSGDYYTALPEAYAEVGYNRFSVKVGKFITPMGHEGGLSADRFFYSLSDAFGMMPVTHSGALASWEGKKLTAFAGWVNGENQFFDTSDDNAFLGGFKYQFSKRLYFGYSALIGTRSDIEPITSKKIDRDYFVQSVIVGYKLNKKWDYTFEWSLRNTNPEKGTTHAIPDGAYGINQELIYRLNKKWAVGFRAEWTHDINAGMGPWPAFAENGDKYAFTLAANWTPNKYLTVRPELRYDKADNGTPNSDWFQEKGPGWYDKQLSGGLSVIVKL